MGKRASAGLLVQLLTISNRPRRSILVPEAIAMALDTESNVLLFRTISQTAACDSLFRFAQALFL